MKRIVAIGSGHDTYRFRGEQVLLADDIVSQTTRTFEIAQAQFHMGVASRQVERTVPDRWRQIVRHRINSLDGNARRSRWAVY